LRESQSTGYRHGTLLWKRGVDYLLTDQSTDAEVVDAVKEQIRRLGPGGRYIMAPVHGLSSIPAHKVKIMIDALMKYGRYPISV
jgi:hypothetical protein